MSLISSVLQIDSKNRFEGNEGDLFELDSLQEKDWDFSYPTLTYEETFDRNILIGENEFKNKFFNLYPELKGIESKHILIAGGCISSLILDFPNKDVDMFIFGCDENQANKIVKDTFEKIIHNLKLEKVERLKSVTKNSLKYNENYSLENVSDEDIDLCFRRTSNSITMNNKYQIILRLYKTKSDILHGFDIGSSAIGFDFDKVYVTGLGKFAYEYKCNILDTTRRSTTYESRLKKYFERGFSIVLPNFSVKKLQNDVWEDYKLSCVCKLPYICFSYQEVKGNRIYIDQFHCKYREENSDYDCESGEYQAFFTNVKNLLKGNDNIVFVERNLEGILDPSVFTRKRITFFYNQILKKLKGSSFPTKMIETYVNIVSPIELFTNKNYEEIIEKQIEETYKLAVAFEEKSKKIKWNLLNPMGQLTGSFNPIIEEAEKWYGEYFTK